MTDVDFYHLQKWPLERALPRLLEKVLEAEKRAVVKLGSAERVEAVNMLLWTYDQASFLPHGSERDGNAEAQPIWLTTGDENPNRASVLVLADGAASDRIGEFERCLDVFDGNDEGAVAAARERWKAYRDTGHSVRYWQQTDRGGWENKT